MIFPSPRADVERFAPEVRNISDDPELEGRYREWKQSREEFNRQILASDSTRDWQKHYYLGKTLRDESFPAHQVKLRVKKFRNLE
jgi:hypothetical protein